jgi:hypothetical protein
MIKKNVQRSLLRENDKSAFPTRILHQEVREFARASQPDVPAALILFAVFIYYPVIQGSTFHSRIE